MQGNLHCGSGLLHWACMWLHFATMSDLVGLGVESASLDITFAAICLPPGADLYDTRAASVEAMYKSNLTGARPRHYAIHRCIRLLHGASALDGVWSAATQTRPALASTMHDHAC